MLSFTSLGSAGLLLQGWALLVLDWVNNYIPFNRPYKWETGVLTLFLQYLFNSIYDL